MSLYPAVFALCAAQLVPAPALTGGVPHGEASTRAFVRYSAEPRAFFEGEVVAIELEVGVDEQFARENLLQMFVQALDLPVQVDAPWFGEPTGAALVASREVASSAPRFSFALGDDVARGVRRGEELRGDHKFAVLALEREFHLLRSGELVVPAPSVRFAFTTKFEPDFFLEPRATDWRLAHVVGEPLVLRVERLPEAGRPPSFGGAVGTRFEIRVDTDVRVVARGEHFDLRVTITGDGNLARIGTPRFAELSDFDVFGVSDSASPGERTFQIELAPRADRIAGIPALEFAYFDRTPPAQYRVVSSPALPLQVARVVKGSSSSSIDFIVVGPLLTWVAVLIGVVLAITAAVVIARRKGDG